MLPKIQVLDGIPFDEVKMKKEERKAKQTTQTKNFNPKKWKSEQMENSNSVEILKSKKRSLSDETADNFKAGTPKKSEKIEKKGKDEENMATKPEKMELKKRKISSTVENLEQVTESAVQPQQEKSEKVKVDILEPKKPQPSKEETQLNSQEPQKKITSGVIKVINNNNRKKSDKKSVIAEILEKSEDSAFVSW
jgi:hypothetical protein